MKLIVGLGNPGRKYEDTRHNIGFMVLDRLAEIIGLTKEEKRFNSFIGHGQINGEKIVLAKPQTYMNLSGVAVGDILNWYKLKTADLLVVYDDLDLPTGRLRLRPGGGTGGHRGMESIIVTIGDDAFPRLRVGIGKPEGERIETVNYVLGHIGGKEGDMLREAVALAADAVICLVRDGLNKAMNTYNKRSKEESPERKE